MQRRKAHLLRYMALALAGSLQLPAAAEAADQGAPLTLEAAIREGLVKSEEAQLVQESEVNVDARKRQVWAEVFPHINFTATAGRGNNLIDPTMFGGFGGDTGAAPAADVFSFTQTRYAYALDAQQYLFSFGRFTKAVKAANSQEKSEANGRRNSRLKLQMQILDAYLGVALARARLGTVESSVKRSRETAAYLESNFKMGAGSRSGLLRAITDLKSLEPRRLNAERDVEASRMQLNRLLGRELDAPLELDTTASLSLAPMGAAPDAKSIEGVVESRPDIQQMALGRVSLENRAKYIKMLYLPSLSARGRVGITAFNSDQLTELDKNREWAFGVDLIWNLFDGRDKLAQAQQIQSDARSLGLNERIARKQAAIEIENAYRDFLAADTSLGATEQAVKAAEEAQALLSQDFRAGKGQLTDLLQSEEELRQTSFQVLVARYQQVRSRAALQVALGKSLINEEAP